MTCSSPLDICQGLSLPVEKQPLPVAEADRPTCPRTPARLRGPEWLASPASRLSSPAPLPIWPLSKPPHPVSGPGLPRHRTTAAVASTVGMWPLTALGAGSLRALGENPSPPFPAAGAGRHPWLVGASLQPASASGGLLASCLPASSPLLRGIPVTIWDLGTSLVGQVPP